MNIIKVGTPPKNKKFKVICYKCETIFEFEEHEGKITRDQRDGDYIGISCPLCGKMVHVDLKKGK